jgi:hypothetical protein
MNESLQIWITTPSRTASTYLQETLEKNYKIKKIYRTHIADECPVDPEKWSRIINIRKDAHAATMSMLIYSMEQPGIISEESYLCGLHTQYNYIRDLPSYAWNSSHTIYMEDFIKNPETLKTILPDQWPSLNTEWRTPIKDRFLSKRNYKEWCINWIKLLEISQLVAKEGHYRGYQIVKDPADPRFSNDRRPNVCW